MKKFPFLLSMALFALMMMPQNMIATDCTFIPDLFPGQAAGRTTTEVSATVHVGEWGPQTRYDETHLINSLTSNNTTAVKVYSNEGYNAAVYFDSVGTADVTYTEIDTRAMPACDGVAQTIHYTVEKGIPTLYFSGQDGMPITEYDAAFSQGGGGDASGIGSYVWTPSYTARYMKLYADGRGGYRMVSLSIPVGELTFTSSNPSVASISANGQTTVNALGTTTISVSWQGNANWEADTASYILNVKKAANMGFSPSLINDTIDKVIKLNVNRPEGVTIDSWQAVNPSIATVDNEGNVTLKAAGTTYVYAYFNGNAEYASAMCRCEINVSKKDPKIAFDRAKAVVELTVEPYEFAHLSAPEDATGTFTWESRNTNKATVDPSTGAVSLTGETGLAQIKCYYSGDDKYLKDTADYWIEITTSGLYINNTLVTSANPDVLGDGSVLYSAAGGEINLTLTDLDYDANGAIFINSTTSTNLNIYVVGNCYITNAAKAIQSNGPLYIWCENKKDSIHITASHTAIQTVAMKVIDCYLFANGGQYGIYTNTFAVWAGGYIFAQGNTEAIHSNDFQRGMANMGGIEVLTKGVTFVAGQGKTQGGFFTDYEHKVYAKYVEIGKIPLPLEKTEVKDIDFKTDNPYDNLDVVFSESEDDSFNATKKQIEITTITADGQITTASAYVTCSSEWLKLLPGVLVFDVPEGTGEIAIQYELAEGFTLQAQIEGVGTATISWANPGWAKIQYNVLQQTHVIIYLQTVSSSEAPAKAPAKTSSLTSGAAIKAIKITPSGLDKYYIVGTFNSWTPNESYRLTLNEAAAPTVEYMLDIALTDGDQLKAVKVAADTIQYWYPNGTGNNCEIHEDGNYTIYFRPNGDGGDGWFYNVLYLVKQSPSGIKETEAEGKTVKVLRDGQIFIIRDGKTYNALGVEVR